MRPHNMALRWIPVLPVEQAVKGRFNFYRGTSFPAAAQVADSLDFEVRRAEIFYQRPCGDKFFMSQRMVYVIGTGKMWTEKRGSPVGSALFFLEDFRNAKEVQSIPLTKLYSIGRFYRMD